MAKIFYVWDEVCDVVLEEKDEQGGVVTEYANEPGEYGSAISQTSNGVTLHFQYDGQGSTRALTNESGNVTDTFTFAAYGETVQNVGSNSTPYQYMGSFGYQKCGESGDLYVRRRTYSPTLGRWLSRDPVFVSSTFNLYQYALSSPVVFADPSGLRERPIRCDGEIKTEEWFDENLGDALPENVSDPSGRVLEFDFQCIVDCLCPEPPDFRLKFNVYLAPENKVGNNFGTYQDFVLPRPSNSTLRRDKCNLLAASYLHVSVCDDDDDDDDDDRFPPMPDNPVCRPRNHGIVPTYDEFIVAACVAVPIRIARVLFWFRKCPSKPAPPISRPPTTTPNRPPATNPPTTVPTIAG